MELVIDGEKLSNPQMMVSECIFESAKVQVVFYVQPACVCATSFGLNTRELREIHIPSTETIIRSCAFNGCLHLLRLVIPESVTQIEPGAILLTADP